MDPLEEKKLEAIRAETKKRGRKLTATEALRVEKKVEREASDRERPPPSHGARGALPLSMYRFD